MSPHKDWKHLKSSRGKAGYLGAVMAALADDTSPARDDAYERLHDVYERDKHLSAAPRAIDEVLELALAEGTSERPRLLRIAGDILTRGHHHWITRGVDEVRDDLDGVDVDALLAAAKLQEALEMITTKMQPLADALTRVQSLNANVQQILTATLALRPFKRDEDIAPAEDHDDLRGERPHLDTRNLHAPPDEVTLQRPPPLPGDDLPDNGLPPGTGPLPDTPGPIIPATGGM